jgi:hypothetical protein
VNIKRVVIIFLALVLLVAGILLVSQKVKNDKTSIKLPAATPTVEEQIEAKFRGLAIPDDAEKVELKNVSGEPAMGIATKNEILADLPDLPSGGSYQVLLGNGAKTILLGTMKQAKGGWILEYDSSKYPGYNQITVVTGTKHILEGSF